MLVLHFTIYMPDAQLLPLCLILKSDAKFGNMVILLCKQVMSLIAYLMEFKGNYGPHLIIVPNAVLVNWKVKLISFHIGWFGILAFFKRNFMDIFVFIQSELHNWLPTVSCIFYVGGKDQRSRLFSHVRSSLFWFALTIFSKQLCYLFLIQMNCLRSVRYSTKVLQVFELTEVLMGQHAHKLTYITLNICMHTSSYFSLLILDYLFIHVLVWLQ